MSIAFFKDVYCCFTFASSGIGREREREGGGHIRSLIASDTRVSKLFKTTILIDKSITNTCKTNTIPILMHQMRISTNEVYLVILRPKKLEIREKKKCENRMRAEKTNTVP
jgi:transcriptional regulator CtsR